MSKIILVLTIALASFGCAVTTNNGKMSKDSYASVISGQKDIVAGEKIWAGDILPLLAWATKHDAVALAEADEGGRYVGRENFESTMKSAYDELLADITGKRDALNLRNKDGANKPSAEEFAKFRKQAGVFRSTIKNTIKDINDGTTQMGKMERDSEEVDGMCDMHVDFYNAKVRAIAAAKAKKKADAIAYQKRKALRAVKQANQRRKDAEFHAIMMGIVSGLQAGIDSIDQERAQAQLRRAQAAERDFRRSLAQSQDRQATAQERSATAQEQGLYLKRNEREHQRQLALAAEKQCREPIEAARQQHASGRDAAWEAFRSESQAITEGFRAESRSLNSIYGCKRDSGPGACAFDESGDEKPGDAQYRDLNQRKRQAAADRSEASSRLAHDRQQVQDNYTQQLRNCSR